MSRPAGSLLALTTAVNPDLYRRLRVPFYGTALVLLLSVFALAEEVRGSKRWIEIGFFNFQPSELGKLALIFALAGFVAERAAPDERVEDDARHRRASRFR